MGTCFGRVASLRGVETLAKSREVFGEALPLSVDQEPEREGRGGRVDSVLRLEIELSRVSETQAREESLVELCLAGLIFFAGLCASKGKSSKDSGSRW